MPKMVDSEKFLVKTQTFLFSRITRPAWDKDRPQKLCINNISSCFDYKNVRLSTKNTILFWLFQAREEKREHKRRMKKLENIYKDNVRSGNYLHKEMWNEVNYI